ncbi:MAG: phosphatidate cytidylyltransferase [Micavibrio sp.]|nr:phosphatidate cytidylyltransferase [Micavibrio sp.]
MTLDDKTASTPEKKIDHSLRTRTKSALIFGPAVIVVLCIGGWAFTLMMAVAAFIGAKEWTRMVMTGKKLPRNLIYLASILTGIAVVGAGITTNPLLGFVFVLALAFVVFAYNFAQHGPDLREFLFGVVYIGFSIDIMVWLRTSGVNAQGLYDMLTLLFIVWASDIAAYFSGKTIGGPKLAPKISPKKTWAGFIGSSVGAGLVAGALATPALLTKFGLHTVGHWGVIGYFIMGFVLAMFGQAGDLFISIFKRRYGIKDTGNFIPGHGGILDRIDALLLVALVFGVLSMIAGS